MSAQYVVALPLLPSSPFEEVSSSSLRIFWHRLDDPVGEAGGIPAEGGWWGRGLSAQSGFPRALGFCSLNRSLMLSPQGFRIPTRK